jgi:hypothetical protein
MLLVFVLTMIVFLMWTIRIHEKAISSKDTAEVKMADNTSETRASEHIGVPQQFLREDLCKGMVFEVEESIGVDDLMAGKQPTRAIVRVCAIPAKGPIVAETVISMQSFWFEEYQIIRMLYDPSSYVGVC